MSRPGRCYCLVPDDLNTAILVKRATEGFMLPVIDLPEQSLKFFPDFVPYIRREIRQVFRLEVTVLQHQQELGDVHICVLELQTERPNQLPGGYEWLATEAFDASSWASVVHQRAVAAWIAECRCDWLFLKRAPWERRGWFNLARTWMQQRLNDAGITIRGPIEQLKGGWPRSAILAAETDQGAVYLKTDFMMPPAETAIIEELSRFWPARVPELIASDRAQNYMLMRDFRGDNLDELDDAALRDAVRIYAEMQLGCAGDRSLWLTLGCPDRSPSRLAVPFRKLLAEEGLLQSPPNGLTEQECGGLQDMLPELEILLDGLNNSVIGTTINNEDFRAGNIVHCDGEYIFFDWSSTVITHPFFGINYLLNRVRRPPNTESFKWKTSLNDERRLAILDAYLLPWRDLATVSELKELLFICRRLYFPYEALRCYAELFHIEPQTPWSKNTEEYVRLCLQNTYTVLRAGATGRGLEILE